MMDEYEDFDEWARIRDEYLYVSDDEEIREWSLFVGQPVTPMRIAELKQELRNMLRRERFENRQGENSE